MIPLFKLKTDDNRGPLELAILDRTDVDGLVQLLRDKCDMILSGTRSNVNVTGYGCNVHKAEFDNALNVR